MSAVRAAGPLDVARVRKTIRDLRAKLTEAVSLLGELYDGRAWVALGLPSWEALCAQEAAAAPAGVSAATAKTWTDNAGVQLATVTSLDGRIRPATSTSTPAKPRLTNVARAVLVVREAGDAGITVHEVTRRLKLHHGATSALLSRLAADGRLTYRPPAKRGQTGTYLAP